MKMPDKYYIVFPIRQVEGKYKIMLANVLIVTAIALLTLAFPFLLGSPGASAEQPCPSALTEGAVNTIVSLVPDSTNGVFDCSEVDVVVGSTGELVIDRHVTDTDTTAGDWGVTLKVKSLTVQEGGKINANGGGYVVGEYEAVGEPQPAAGTTGGSGGGHGGAGGEGLSDGVNNPAVPGTAYGSQEVPSLLGSAGGNSGDGGHGGAGGGALKIWATGGVTVNGTISANGLPGTKGVESSGGGGAGGSIWIEANTLAGSGLIEARGGASDATVTYPGGGGGGGRVIIFCTENNNYSGSANVNPGQPSMAQAGGVGTILGPTCLPHTPTVLKQFKSDGTTEIISGGATTEDTVIFASDLVDPDSNETLTLQVEFKPLGTAFSNVPTYTQSTPSANPQVCTSGTSSDCGKITAANITRSREYHWQARVRDSKGGFSEWVNFGANTEAMRDVLVTGTPSAITLFSGNNQSGVVATELSDPFVVKITDSEGFPIPGYSVSWVVTDSSGGGQLSQGSSIASDVNGLVTNTYRLGTLVGTNTVEARATGLTGTPIVFTSTSTAGALDHFSVTAPQVAIVGQNFGTVTITAKDQYENLITNYSGTPALTAVAPTAPYGVLSGTLTPSTVTFNSQDTLTFENATYSEAASMKIQVTDGSAIGRSNIIAVVTSVGSCPDADGIIDTNQTWTATSGNQGIFDCSGMTIQVTNGATLTLASLDSGDTNYNNDYGTTVLAANVTVDAGAFISANNQGYQSGRGPGAGSGGYCWSIGPSHGGYGDGKNGSATIYGSVYEPNTLGSASGTQYGGTGGGGAIKLVVSGTTTINGTVSADGGATAGDCNTGGAGGSVWIDTDVLAGSSTMVIRAIGQKGNNKSTGAGGGGRVAVYYSSTELDIGSYVTTNKINALGYTTSSGESNGTRISGAGTVYIEHKGTHSPRSGNLYVSNNSQNGKTAGLVEDAYVFNKITTVQQGHLAIVGQNSALRFTSSSSLVGDSSMPDIVVEGTINYLGQGSLDINGVDLNVKGALSGVSDFSIGNTLAGGMTLYANTWYYNNSNQHDFDNVTVGPNGVMTLIGYDNGDTNYTNDYAFTLNADSLDIQEGGSITSDGKGYGIEKGPGYGGTDKGSSYGGYGWNNSDKPVAMTPYGSVYEPSDLGSGSRIQPGGGAIKFVISGTLNVDGTISSNGPTGCCNHTEGPSGGSIWIDAGTFDGAGVITANGGDEHHDGGDPGSGGRIALYYTNNSSSILSTLGTDSPKIRAYGGFAGGTNRRAGAGTVYVEHKGVDTNRAGALYVDNSNGDGTNGVNSKNAGLISASYEFKSITLTRSGHLDVVGAGSSLSVSSGSAFTGDATSPDLNLFGTFAYTGEGTLGINGVNIGVRGEISGVNSFTIGSTTAAGVSLYANTWAHNKDNQYTFENITVGPVGTLSLNSYNNGDADYTNDYGASLSVTNLDIDNGGVITSQGTGYLGGPGSGDNGDNEFGGSYGGYGGRNSAFKIPYGNVFQPTDLGSSGGIRQAGGYKGGGAIKLIVSSTLTNDGTITSDGEAYTRGGWDGGSTGGSIWIDANKINGSGVIKSNGQRGDSAGGAGGRIAVYYKDETSNFPFTNTANMQAYGGIGNTQNGGPGTVYVEKLSGSTPEYNGNLFIDNNNQNTLSAALVEGEYVFESIRLTKYGHLTVLGNASKLTINSGAGMSGDATFPDINIEGTLNYTGGSEAFAINGVDLVVKGDLTGITNVDIGDSIAAGMTLYANTWAHDKNNQYSLGNVTVSSNGTLTLYPYNNADSDYTNDYGVTLTVESMTVEAGGVVTAKGLGYLNGPGSGDNGDTERGGSYGGYGGNNTSFTYPYGNVYEPIDLGSSGGIRQAGGYKGGGAIKLVVNTVLTLNGTITSDGESYTRGGWDGGAAGGSIWIDANRINGNGAIKSNGERGDGAGGSGGRIAIYYQDSDSSFPFTNTSNVQAYGGSGTVQYGGPGTIYIEHKGTDTSKSGLLLVDGNNVNTNSAALISDTYSFKTIKLTRYGHLKMTGQDAVLNVTSGAGFEGDNTFPDLTVEGTINYTGSEALEINGVDLGVAGEITGVTNFSLGTKAKAGMTLYANTWAHNKDDQYSFGDVTVGASGTLTLVSYDNQDSDYSNDYGVTVNLTNLTVLAGGRISADGQGYLNGRGPGAGNGGYCWATGPSHGGYGMTASGAAGTTYGSITEPISLGSASGTQYGGTGGGGSLKLVISGTLTIEGTISADGGNTSGDCNTGGAGGSIWINTATIDGDAGAIISADGAKGNINNQGVGGGGRVAIYYSTDELNIENMITSGGIRAYGGYDGTRSGGPGTVYIENKTAGYNGAGDLYIKNNYSTTAYSGSFNGNYAFHDVTIGNGVRVKVEGNKDTNTGTVLQVSGDFTLGTGALIDGVGQGFGSGEGPGKGASGVGQSGGGGGAHGGSGGAGQSDGSDASNIGGSSYGNQRIPVTLGSGGGPSGAGAAGGAGGGAFALRARDGHVQIDGDINVSGTNGKVSSPGGGGGAGGSILVEAATCEINGDLYANGGDGGNNSYDGGGAGGGRISILYTTGPCNVLGTVVSAQGTSESGQAGQAGIFPGTLVLPSVPSVREQYKSDETTNIPVGEVTQEKEVILKASIFDPGASDANPRNLVAEFEVAPKDENFSGGVLGTSVVTSNPISFKGGDPTLASATVTGLTPGEGYKWQVRVKNVDDGVSSEWVEFGANPADDADFVVGTVEELRIEVDKNEVNVGDKITITVKAYDAEGEIDPSYEGTVTFGSTSDTAVLPANYIFSSADDQGEHVFSEELIFTEGGTFTVTVTDAISEELTATTGEITVIAPEPESPTDPGDVEEKTCEEDVNQAECQLDVEITDITVSIDKDSAKICYKTNIETRGFIEYGKIVNKKATYSSTTSMDEYAKDHCFELTKLSEKQAYAYKINAVSYAGKTAETQATFATKGGKAPVQDDIVVEEPIKNVNYSFDSDNNAVLRFEVIKNSRCYVDYGHILSDLENRALSNSQGTSHKAYLELDKLNGTSDLIYVITCSTIEDDDKKIQTYTKNGVITHAKYKKYYPQPKQEKQTVTSFIESISQTEVPVVLTAAAATTSILSLLLYPRFVLYAVGWLTGRRRVRNWGLIFDTATNEAVAFAVVKLYDKTGKLIQENVTDIHGQYGFTVDKGEFNLIAEHPEYNQQEVSVTSKDEGMITKDVGLTPKVVKTKGAKVKKQLKVNWRKLNAVLFVIGFMFSLIALVLYPVTYNLVIFLLYSLQIIILYLLRTPRGWGYVYDSLNSRRLQGAFVRLWDPQQGTQLKVQLTDSKGRYGFINGRGNYELTVDKAGYRFPSAKDSVNNMSVTRTGQKMIKVSTTEFKPINQTIPVDPDSEGVSGPFGN